MKKSIAVLLAAVSVLSLSTAILAASLYTLTLPAQVTIDQGNWTLYSNSACTTPITSINFGTVPVGGNSTQVWCLKNTSSGNQWLTSNSVTSSLPSADGTITVTKITSPAGYAFSFPLEFQPTNTALITLLLKASTTAPASTTAIHFSLNITAYSTSSG